MPLDATLPLRRLALLALLPAAFAMWLHGPVWNGGLLSDDLALMTYLVAPGTSAPVLWSRVAEDFVGPWAFGSGHYYRPLTTLMLALEYQAGGGAPWVFHVSGILAFGFLVFSCGLLCGRLAGRAAVVPGALWLAAHPSAHEPICWMCTRADFLVLIAGAWACLAFVAHLQHGRRRHLAAAVAASVLALLSKENGVLLAVWFLLLDLTVRGSTVSLRSRLWLHLRIAPLWLAYVASRWWLFGAPFGEPVAGSPASLSAWLLQQGNKLSACVAPVGDAIPPMATLTAGLLTAWVLVVGAWWPPNRRFVALGAGWLLVALLPVHRETVGDDLLGSRFVLASCFGAALAIGPVLGSRAVPRAVRVLGHLLLALAVTSLGIGTRDREQDYLRAWPRMQSLCEQIDAAGRQATVDRPLALLFADNEGSRVHFLVPGMSFPLAETPIAAADHAFVALNASLEGEADRWALRRDTGPLRAMWWQGARLAYWSAARTAGVLEFVPPPEHHQPRVLDAGDDGRFLVRGEPASPWAIGGVRVTSDAEFASGELTWFVPSAAPHGAPLPIGAARWSGATWTAEVDLEQDWDFLQQGIAADGIGGFQVSLTAPTAAAPVKARAVEIVPPRSPAPIAEPLRGRTLPLADLAARLPWSELPAPHESASVVLMNGSLSLRLELHEGRLITPLDIALLTRELRHWLHVDRCYYYLECRRAGRLWRSAVDWFVLDVAGG